MKQRLLRQRITKPRFRWNLSADDANTLLTAAYAAEVEYRCKEFRLDDGTKRNIRHVSEFITKPSPKFGILLCGNPGNGKTTMLCAFQQATNYLVRSGMFSAEAYKDYNVGLHILDARDITHEAKDYKGFQRIKQHFMLGVEDIGREPTEVLDYGNILNPVIDLLESRYRDQLFTFITTNLTPKQIREKYGNRIADRFNESVECVVFENSTYRHSRP